MAKDVLHPLRLEKLVDEWLLEDVPSFDYAGAVAGEEECTFDIMFKSEWGMLAGLPFADAVFHRLGLGSRWYAGEGNILTKVTKVGSVFGPARNLLLAERIALNVISRASGVATTAAKLRALLEQKSDWTGRLAATRKTTPGFRMVEKYALLVARVDTHRYDLSSMVMLKDNHIAIAGSVKQAVKKARSFCGFSLKIEVECNSLEQAMEAASAGCDIVMLDNFDPENFVRTATLLKEAHPQILIEASGAITAGNILKYAVPCADIISTSSLVQGYQTIDVSMKVLQ